MATRQGMRLRPRGLFSVSWICAASVLCIFTALGQWNRYHRDRPTGTSLQLLRMVPALWAAGDPRIGRYLTGPRPVP